MRLPRLSSFTIIGVILVAIGIFGLFHGSKFQYDTGVQAEDNEGWYYILVGVIMVVNGFFWSPQLPEERNVKPTGGNKAAAPTVSKDAPAKTNAPAAVKANASAPAKASVPTPAKAAVPSSEVAKGDASK